MCVYVCIHMCVCVYMWLGDEGMTWSQRNLFFCTYAHMLEVTHLKRYMHRRDCVYECEYECVLIHYTYTYIHTHKQNIHMLMFKICYKKSVSLIIQYMYTYKHTEREYSHDLVQDLLREKRLAG